MKKIFFVCVFAVLFSLSLTAQEKKIAKYSHTIGANFNTSIPLGEFADYTGIGFGGGLVYELGLPIPCDTNSSVLESIFDNFKVTARTNFTVLTTDDSRLDFVSNLQVVSSVLTKIDFGNSGLALAPELGIGIDINILKTSEANTDDIDNIYVDQIYMFGCGFRFSNPKLCNGNLEFELTPTYSLSPEKDGAVHYLSCRLGFLYNLTGF